LNRNATQNSRVRARELLSHLSTFILPKRKKKSSTRKASRKNTVKVVSATQSCQSHQVQQAQCYLQNKQGTTGTSQRNNTSHFHSFSFSNILRGIIKIGQCIKKRWKGEGIQPPPSQSIQKQKCKTAFTVQGFREKLRDAVSI